MEDVNVASVRTLIPGRLEWVLSLGEFAFPVLLGRGTPYTFQGTFQDYWERSRYRRQILLKECRIVSSWLGGGGGGF